MTVRPKGARLFLRLLSCIRFDEVLVLQGAPLLGALFSIGTLTFHRVENLLVFAVASCLLVAHIFVLNDWSGIRSDLQDPSRSVGVFLNRGIRRIEMGSLALVLLALSLVLLVRLGALTLALGLMIAVLSALYSAPFFHWKGVPVFNSILHLAGGLLHFLLGYSVFGALDGRGLEIGCFFAIMFTAGHLTQEVRDTDADLHNGIRTNAVRFGKARCFAAGFALFTLADALLIMLAVKGTVPHYLIVVAALFPLHWYWSWSAMRAGLTFESVRRLQVRYRALYAIVGAAMAIAALS